MVNTAAEIGGSDLEITSEENGYFNFIRGMLKKVLQTAVKKGGYQPTEI